MPEHSKMMITTIWIDNEVYLKTYITKTHYLTDTRAQGFK